MDGDLTDVYRGPEVTFRLDSLTPGRSYRFDIRGTRHTALYNVVRHVVVSQIVIECVSTCRCRVCAISSGGQGVWSKEALFQTPPSLPHPPSDLSVVGKVTQSSTALSWSELSVNTARLCSQLLPVPDLRRSTC